MFGLDLGNLLVHLKLDGSGFDAVFNSIETKLNATATKMTWAGTKMSLAVTTPILLYGRQMVKAFEEQQNATEDLTAILDQQGTVVAPLIRKFSDFALKVQQTTIYSDEAVLSSMAYAKNLGVTTDQLEQVTQAAIGLASKFRWDLGTAMMYVGRASQGHTERLARYIPQLDAAKNATEKFNTILKVGGDAYYLAERKLNTYSGALQHMHNIAGEAMEAFGEKIANKISMLFSPIEKLSNWFTNLNNSAQNFIVITAIIVAAIGPVGVALGVTGFAIQNLIAFIGGFLSIVGGLIGILFSWVGVILLVAALAYTLYAAWEANFGGIRDIFQGLLNTFKQGYDWLANSVIGEFIRWMSDAFVGVFRTLQTGWKDFIANLAGNAAGIVAFLKNIRYGFAAASEAWANAYLEAFNKAKTGVDDFIGYTAVKFEAAGITLKGWALASVQTLEELLATVKTQFGKDADAIIALINSKIQKIKDTAKNAGVEADVGGGGTHYVIDQSALEQMRLLNKELDNEYNLLGLVDDERQRAVNLTKFQELAEKAYGGETAKTAKAIADYNAKLIKLGEGKRGVAAFQVQLRNWNSEATNIFKNMGEVATNAFDGIAESITQMCQSGKFDFKQLVASIGHDLLLMLVKYAMARAMFGLIGSGGGGLGFLGSIFGAIGGMGGGIGNYAGASAWADAGGADAWMAAPYHSGGIVGSIASARCIPSATFIGAPRYHMGLAADERPAILQTGEGVISRKGMARLNNGESGGGVTNNPVIVIQAWDTSDIVRNRKTIEAIISDSIKRNGDIRKVMKDYK
jgi:lambda family phage tail tape measure protein